MGSHKQIHTQVNSPKSNSQIEVGPTISHLSSMGFIGPDISKNKPGQASLQRTPLS